jgi:hypothetical protein
MMRVDYYIGRPVTGLVILNKPTKDSWKYALMIEGDTEIRFWEGDAPLESEVVGTEDRPTRILAVTNHENGDVTIVVGGDGGQLFEITAKVMKYSIVDPKDPQAEWFPTSLAWGDLTLPPDPSLERVVSGPEPQTGTDQGKTPEEPQNG